MGNRFDNLLNRIRGRHPPEKSRNGSFSFVMEDDFSDFCINGYTPLSKNPEILTAVGKIAELVASMTIHLMENEEIGDKRIHDQLSAKLDIDINPYSTRKTFMEFMVRTMLLEGNGNAFAIPMTKNGLLEGIYPVPANQVSIQNGMKIADGYKVYINGVQYDPSELIHFIAFPSSAYPYQGEGYKIALRDLNETLTQASKTKKNFMQKQWRPSVIVRLAGSTEEMDKKTQEKFIKRYVYPTNEGEPLLIPADSMDIQQIKPLTINDLAINDSVKLDKTTVASILGVPPYVVGIGEFRKEEWNHFIQTRVMSIAKGIEQELTKKLIISNKRYIKLNPWSLYAYSMNELASVGMNLYSRGILTGNEVRDWISKEPKAELNELVMLENYIPRTEIGNQKKLNKELEGWYDSGENNGTTNME